MSQAATNANTGADTGSEQPNLELLIGSGADAQALATYLDGLDPQHRVEEVQGLPGAALPALYERCEKAPPLKLEDMVPAVTPDRQQVIFAGRNNLPLFTKFEKRFARTEKGQIIGYNHQTMAAFTGPGYFVVEPAGDELVIDYTQLPVQEDAPTDWPVIKPNNRGLSHFVYKNMKDYCRRVSRDVVIGHATKLGESLPHYFVLARRPPPEPPSEGSE